MQSKLSLLRRGTYFFSILLFISNVSCEKDKTLYETLQEFEPSDQTETIVDSEENDLESDSDEDVSAETDELETTENNFIYSNSVFYVDVSGDEINDGKTENTAWTIDLAFNRAKPGDTIFIKAGNYGNVNLLVNNSDTEQGGIYFIGYKDFPLDTNTDGASSVSYEEYKIMVIA